MMVPVLIVLFRIEIAKANHAGVQKRQTIGARLGPKLNNGAGVSNPPDGMSEFILLFQILFALPFAANDYVGQYGTGYGLVALVFGFLLAAGAAAMVAYRKLRRTGL